MKKSLEDELMGLAHRILQLRGRDEIHEMKKLAGELYEKLTILSFTEKYFSGPRPTIGQTDIEEALAKDIQQESAAIQEKAVTQPERTKADNIVETKPVIEKEKFPEDTLKEPAKEEKTFPESVDPIKTEAPEKDTSVQEDTDDLSDLGVSYDELPDFEPISPSESQKANPTTGNPEPPKKTPEKEDFSANLFSSREEKKTKNDLSSHKKSLNERLKKGLSFGLNDRHAFIKNLFDGDATDFNRVISQLNSFDTFPEAKAFIEQTVKPDYDWSDKEKYEERFLNALESRLE